MVQPSPYSLLSISRGIDTAERSRLTVPSCVATGAAALRAEAAAMSTAMDAVMWDTDHYVTQVNPEPGPAGPRGISTDGMNCAKAHNCRDFVDYDSNVRQQHNCSAPARRPGTSFYPHARQI